MKTLEEILNLEKLNIIEVFNADEEILLRKGFEKNENSFVLTNHKNFDLIKIDKGNFNKDNDIHLNGLRVRYFNDIDNLINSLNEYFKSNNQNFEEGKDCEQNFNYINTHFDIGINISGIKQINIRISKNHSDID